MSESSSAPQAPDPSRCATCSEIHPRGCTGHVEECTACEWRGGNQVGRPCVQCGGIVRGRACRDSPIKGGTVCVHHGGRSPQVQAAADRKLVEADAVKELKDAKVRPIGDPIVALGELAGEAVAFWEVAKARAADGAGPDDPWFALSERSLERAGKILAACGRLGLEQRRVQLEEAQLDLAAAVMRRAWVELGHDPDDPQVQAALDVAYVELGAG